MIFPIISLGILILGLDQFIKWWLGEFFPQALIENQGIIFGWRFLPMPWLWLIFCLLLIFAFSIIRKLQDNKKFLLGAVLIISGALSNLVDRFLRENILDYFRLGKIYFNLADLAIIAGLIIISLQILCQKFSK